MSARAFATGLIAAALVAGCGGEDDAANGKSSLEVMRADGTRLPADTDGSPTFFLLDADAEPINELSSNQEDAAGTIEVAEWGCERGDSVRLIVDTTLASELHDLPNAKVTGEVEAEIGDPVDVYG